MPRPRPARLGALALAASLAACGTGDRADIQSLLDRAALAPARTLGEADLAGLPDPVQRYLRRAGVLGAPQIRAMRARGRAEILFEGKWLPLESELYVTTAPFSRNWLGAGSYLRIPISARDSYAEGEGRMSIRLMEDARFQESHGPEMDRGQLVTLLAEFITVPTGWLSESVAWEPVDGRSARVALTDSGITVRGTLRFDAQGDPAELIVDEDRFETVGGEFVPRRWSARCERFEVVQGRRTCTVASGVWLDDPEPLEYVRSRLDEIEFDTFELY